jgi:hypothetical protein
VELADGKFWQYWFSMNRRSTNHGGTASMDHSIQLRARALKFMWQDQYISLTRRIARMVARKCVYFICPEWTR